MFGLQKTRCVQPINPPRAFVRWVLFATEQSAMPPSNTHPDRTSTVLLISDNDVNKLNIDCGWANVGFGKSAGGRNGHRHQNQEVRAKITTLGQYR
jgi:hypothetical protein